MRLLFVISLFLSCNVSAQVDSVQNDPFGVQGLKGKKLNQPLNSGYVHDLNFDYEFKYGSHDHYERLRFHPSLKPYIVMAKPEMINVQERGIQLKPLADLNTFIPDNGELGYRVGAGVSWNKLINNQWHFKIAGVQGVYAGDSAYRPKSYLNWRESNANLYTDIRSRISYTPNQIFNFQAGVDHNFFGEGSRSLFQSDYGNPFPFGLIRTRFWRAEYSILYQFLREGTPGNWGNKFVSSHHISFNITNWLNLGIFESVVFNPNDTLLNRGFDVEYLNPIVFYRPQEYSIGSSDNVLMGVDLTGRFRNISVYSQFVLDEFYLAEIRAKSRWWANKYGGQFGVKGKFGTPIGSLYLRSEFNFVRPYTFAHLNDKLSYTNQGLPLAHPYGASFAEVLLEANLKRDLLSFYGFVSYSLRGGDFDSYNYGADLLQPYINRPFEYDHKIGQGAKTNQCLIRTKVSVIIPKMKDLSLFLENNLRYTIQGNNTQNFVLLGARYQLWNDYRNY